MHIRLKAFLCILCLFVAVPFRGVAGQAPQTATASITIDTTKVEGEISPMLYGQFTEFMFEGIKRGMFAELLLNRSFEEAANAIGLSRYWERYPDDRNDDFALNFTWDNSVSYPERTDANGHSTRVDAGEGVIPRHGFYQSRIPIRAGLEYRGYLWLRGSDYNGTITLSLEQDTSGGKVYAQADVARVENQWRKYAFTLTPTHTDALARFAVLFNGRGRVWVDQVSLMPGDAVEGIRHDVFQQITRLHPAFVRWPGGNVAQDYIWTWGIGPRDERPTWINLSWKNELEPSDFGTDEFVAFCRRIGAEPSITVNVEGRGATVEDAAAWVEYCNGPPNSRWGSLRAKNGHPQPYNVKLWEIGNEIWGNWVRGHSNAETYARNFNRYAAAMKAVDPTIKLIACGDNDMSWNRTVLNLAGERIDLLAIHHYYGTSEMQGDPLNLMARPLFYENFYKEVRKLIDQVVPGRAIKLAINEWNTSLPESRQHSMEAALYGARLMNVFERSDMVQMSAVSDLVNGWPGGIIQASRHNVYMTPTGLVNALYASHAGRLRLATTVSGPTFDSTREGRNVPYLDVVASRSRDRRQVFIKAVNTDTNRSLSTTVTVVGATPSRSAVVETVTANSITVSNTFAEPQAVTIRRAQLRAGQKFQLLLPKHSVSVITLDVNP